MLIECAIELTLLQSGAISHAHVLHLNSYGVIREVFLKCANTLCSLVRTVNCNHHVAVLVLS